MGDPLVVRAHGRAGGSAQAIEAIEAIKVAVPAARPGRVEPGRARPAEERPQQQPPLKVVPRQVRRRRAGLVIAVGVTFVFTLMLGLVAFQARIAQGQMKLDRTERDLREAETRYAQLRLQVAQLEAPTRVIEEAEHLGLVRPAPKDVTYLRASSDVVGPVLAAGGAEEDGPAGTADATDWASLKPLLQASP
jgi:cell division protein FtsL